MIVNVGTENKGKIIAVRNAFHKFFPDVTVHGLAVPSEVSKQPVGLVEMTRGAESRARNAFVNQCDLSVGIESGIFEFEHVESGYLDSCACAIYDGKKYLVGLSPAFEVPVLIVKEIFQKGKELSEAFREIAGEGFNREGSGALGYLSQGKYSREEFTIQGLIMALLPKLNMELYRLKK